MPLCLFYVGAEMSKYFLKLGILLIKIEGYT